MRFDPQDLHAGVQVYDRDGRYLGFAPVTEVRGFRDVDAARQHEGARNAYMKGKKLQLTAVNRMNALQVAAMLPSPEPDGTPDVERRIVAHDFRSQGSAALKVQAAAVIQRQEERDADLDQRSANILKLFSDSDD